MSIQEQIMKMKIIQDIILSFLEKESCLEEKYSNLNKIFNNVRNCEDHYELKALLYLLLEIGNNYHRKSDFYIKIEQILQFFKSEIQKKLSNSEIFDIFIGNKRILLFLIKEKVITIDDYIIKTLNSQKYQKLGYYYYFYPELKTLQDIKLDETVQEIENNPELFERKRLIGENGTELSRIIRGDCLDEFISFIEQNKLTLSSKIGPSIYETNNFLIDKRPSLIEYASFFGSMKIFEYLTKNGAEIDQTLLIYSIHSQNLKMIQIIEKKVFLMDQIINNCFIESIKCHHNEIVNYFQNILASKNKDLNIFSTFSKIILKHYNYSFIPNELNNENIFFNLCKYDYITLVEDFLNTINIDINGFTETKLSLYSKREIIEKSETVLYVASKKGNKEIVQLLLSQKKIDVNKKSTIHHFYFYKDEIEVKTALNVAVEKERNDVIKLLLSQENIDVNNKAIFTCQKNEYKKIEEKPSFYTAIEKENIDIINLLLNHQEIDVNNKFIIKEESRIKFNTERTPLFLAVEKRNLEIIKALLSCQKIDIMAKTIDENQLYTKEQTVIHLAAKIGDMQIFQLLSLHPGIDFNCKIKKMKKSMKQSKTLI